MPIKIKSVTSLRGGGHCDYSTRASKKLGHASDENHVKHTNELCGYNEELTNVKLT
jgi:hypothetical protein